MNIKNPYAAELSFSEIFFGTVQTFQIAVVWKCCHGNIVNSKPKWQETQVWWCSWKHSLLSSAERTSHQHSRPAWPICVSPFGQFWFIFLGAVYILYVWMTDSHIKSHLNSQCLHIKSLCCRHQRVSTQIYSPVKRCHSSDLLSLLTQLLQNSHWHDWPQLILAAAHWLIHIEKRCVCVCVCVRACVCVCVHVPTFFFIILPHYHYEQLF